MPFAQRIVSPIRLSRKPVDKENQFDLDIVTNNSLVAAIKQLSSLAGHADELFNELSQELVKTVQKADKLKNKVDNLAEHVSKLNAKAVKVPESDLESYAKTKRHYYGNNNYHSALFSPESRPNSVKVLYEGAEENPVRIIRQCNANRTDGRTGSKLFSLTPYFQDEGYQEKDEDFQVKAPPASDGDRKDRPIPEPKSRPKSMPHFPEIEVRPCSPDTKLLPTPEDRTKLLSRSQPVTLVPIDITGSGFDRMCEYRESVRSTSREYIESGTQSLKKKKKRRPTVSGAPGLVLNEVSTSMFNVSHTSPAAEFSTRSMSRERPKSAALESYAPRRSTSKGEGRQFRSRERKDKKDKYDPDESNLSRSCSLRRSLRSLFKDKRAKSTDLWAEGRPRSPGPPVVDLQAPLKRSRSLPRSLKSVMKSSVSQFSNNRCASTEGRLDARSDEDLTSEKSKPSPKTDTSRTNHSSQKTRKIPRSVSHNSNLSYSTFVDNLDRPKSMELGPNTFAGSGSPSSRLPIPVSTPTMPTSTESVPSSTAQESKRGAGKHVHVHIPDKPWTKPFADVKLRGSIKTTGPSKEERQSSSSGHWSASSSSVRHSLESDYPRSASSPERLSQCDQDSAVSLNIHPPDRSKRQNSEDTTTTGDGDSSTLNGDSSDNESVINVKTSKSKMSTEEWLQTVKNKKVKSLGRSKSNASQSSVDSGRSAKNSQLTTRNLRAHDDVHKSSSSKGMSRFGDDESSIYSIDQEGFYTSMHKDCGIRRSNEQLLEEDEDNMSSVSDETETNSPKPKSHSNISKKFSSFLTKRSTVKRKDKRSLPPAPPPRGTASLSKSNVSPNDSGTSNESPQQTELQKLAALANKMAAAKAREAQKLGNKLDRSTSFESDAESIYARVRVKSTISPSAIPSLCLVTPTQTDDEDAEMLGYSSAWKASDVDDSTYQKYTGSLKSSKSAPGTLHDSFTLVSPDSSVALTSPDVSSDKSEVPSMSGSSTWPRSPKPKPAASTPKTHLLTPPDSLTIKPPNYSLFYADDSFAFVDSRHAIPEVKTPDSVLDSRREFNSPTNNTFKDPQEAKTPSSAKGKGRFVFDTPSINSVLSANATAVDNVDSTFSSPPAKENSSRASNWGSTWPRRKGLKVAQVIAEKLSKDDSVLDIPTSDTSTNTSQKSFTLPRSGKGTKSYQQKGDRAHFINTKSRTVQPPKSLQLSPTGENGEPLAAHAKLVISSPVANRACFVENPYKRSVCSPVTADDLLKFWNYSSADQWYNTLPRKGRHEVKHSLSFSSAEGIKDRKADDTDPNINTVAKSSTMYDFGTLPRSKSSEDGESTLTRPSKPMYPSILSMKHSLSFGSPQKKDTANVEFGRTWYDGVDANSAVVVMSPDGTSQKGPGKSGFSNFLREHSLGTPSTGNRRGSNASSISTNSSSSGKKSVTFASVHRASSSSLSRTSLDATSITSSQISGDVPHGSDTRSLISDDGIQVTPQKREPPHLQQREPPKLLSTALKRSSTGSSDIPVCTCPLETIIGSDSEMTHGLNDSEDELKTDRDSVSPPKLLTFSKPVSGNEPTTKKLKVNTKVEVSRPSNRSPKARLSPRSRMKHATVHSSTFAGPSIKVDAPVDKVITDCGTEIKPMPLIKTTFVGTGAKTDTPTSPKVLQDGKPPGDSSSLKRFVFPSVKKPEIVLKATPVRSETSPPKTVVSRPVGPPPPPPNTNSATVEVKSSVPPKTGTIFNLVKSKPVTGKTPVEVKSGSPAHNGPVFQVAKSKPVNAGDKGPATTINTQKSETSSIVHNAKVSAPSSAMSPVSSTSSSTSSTTKTSTSTFLSLKRPSITSAPSATSTSSVTLSLKRSTSPPSSASSSSSTSSVSNFSSLKRTQSSTAATTTASITTTFVATKPTPPKFILPKLRTWSPSAVETQTSSILSTLSAESSGKPKQDDSGGQVKDSGDGASNGHAIDKSKGESLGASGAQTTLVPKEKSVPEGALPSGPESPKDSLPPKQRSVKAVNLNKSFGDALEVQTPLQKQATTNLNKSTGNLNQWSKDHHGSSLSLARSTTNLAIGSISTGNLNGSSWSLAKSTDSLASTSSTAEKSRAAKLAFLNSGAEPPAPSGDNATERFSRTSLSSSRTSLAGKNEGGKPPKIERSVSTSSASSSSSRRLSSSSSVEKENNNNNSRKSSTSSTSSPVQGKFVSCVLGQLQKKGLNASTTKISQVDCGETSPR